MGRKILLLYLFLASAVVFTCLSVPSSALSVPQRHRRLLVLLEDTDIEQEEDEQSVAPIKKKSTTISSSSKNITKSLKPSLTKSSSTSTKSQTKLIKPVSSSLKNKTKSVKSDSDGDGYTLQKNKLKTIKSVTDLSATKSGTNKQNSTSSKANPSKKSSDLLNLKSSTTEPATEKINKKKDNEKSNSDQIKKKKKTAEQAIEPATEKINKKKKDEKSNSDQIEQATKKLSPPTWNYNSDEDSDLVSDFRDLPTKFQKTFIPDLRRISSSSQIYFSKANKEMTKGVKPYVGNKYAPSIATAISFTFIIIPFLLVSLLFNKIKTYFSLQKLLIFIQIYLSIYFTILCLSSLITGLEPLKFFYATSQSTYVWLQVLQTLGYVLYLLLLLMYLVLVFSTECGLGSKLLGLAQTFVGFAVGLHYYMTVFHRVVLRQPPKTSWKVHAVYATCFLVICLLVSADRRKKAYLGEGGEEGKKS